MEAHPSIPEFENAPVLDALLLSEARSVMKAKFPQMVDYFIEDTQSYINYIEKALADNNTEALIPPAHTAKSSSRQMGAMRLSLIAKAIELEARDAVSLKKDPQSIDALLSHMKVAFTQTREAFTQVA